MLARPTIIDNVCQVEMQNTISQIKTKLNYKLNLQKTIQLTWTQPSL